MGLPWHLQRRLAVGWMWVRTDGAGLSCLRLQLGWLSWLGSGLCRHHPPRGESSLFLWWIDRVLRGNGNCWTPQSKLSCWQVCQFYMPKQAIHRVRKQMPALHSNVCKATVTRHGHTEGNDFVAVFADIYRKVVSSKHRRFYDSGVCQWGRTDQCPPRLPDVWDNAKYPSQMIVVIVYTQH